MTESRTARSAKLINEARTKRSQAASRTFGDPLAIQEATQLEREAKSLMALESTPEISTGEIVPTRSGTDYTPIAIRNTLENPSQITADASRERMELLMQPGLHCIELALDTAETIGAKNSMEKMLAHQMAAAHSAAMKYQAKALALVNSATPSPQMCQESVRMTNAAVRLMTAFQEGMQTLQRIRSGGRQTVVVQHVTVEAGGQAAIGNLQPPGAMHRGEAGSDGK